ncbi:hypothetical protein [Nonomuraea roseoviolacea]|uniref:CU044_5270 family protein n=1 Tax=Nonomuraea roseoviolacea subsp. carminata TaxID=160689 RepID=A0ABT1KDX7_9ACTN|nr:hypothetical protein [Nonomuraea roseoviolacea]MCP2352217.1 hypothetical protein [Nonomuraea roseoviolacea subsp. carminata]
MKRGTVPVRPLIALAAVGATVLLGLPGPARTPELRLTGAASAPPGGAYWHTRELWEETSPRQLGGGSHRYWVVEPLVTERWSAPDGRSWVGSRRPGAYPKSAADRESWRRDGSPTKWTRTADGRPLSLSGRPDKGSVGPERGDGSFALARQRLTYDELQRLPADPDGLKSWLTRAARVQSTKETFVDSLVTQALTSLLHELPVPKEVRAAAYRALPTMPGVRVKGTAKDGAGRTGTALSIDPVGATPKDALVARSTLIVDAGAMVLLADDVRATMDGKPFLEGTGTRTILQAGWTDAAPAVPALP